MRVLHLISSLSGENGGPSRTVPNLCQSLSKEGVQISLATWSAGEAPPEIGRAQLAGVKLSIISQELSLRSCLKDVDLVHVHGCWTLNLNKGIRAARNLDIKYIISPRGMIEPWALAHHSFRKKIAWLVYQRQDLHGAIFLHATANSEARQFRDLHFRQPIAVLPNGVNKFDLHSGVKKNRRRILFCSRIHPKKGLPLLVEACYKHRQVLIRDNWEIVIAGPDEGCHLKYIKTLVEKAGLVSVFSFFGEVDGVEKENLFRSADYLVLPTYSENFGVVVAEALAAGIPVITTRGAPWEDLTKYKCGWWVEINVEALANALIEALQLNECDRIAMGLRGRVMCENLYSWKVIGVNFRKAYEWALADKIPMPQCMIR